MADSQPTTIKTDPNFAGLKRDGTEMAGGGGCYPSNDPSPHGQGEGHEAPDRYDEKSRLTPASHGKQAATYTTSVAPHGQESRNHA